MFLIAFVFHTVFNGLKDASYLACRSLSSATFIVNCHRDDMRTACFSIILDDPEGVPPWTRRAESVG